MNPTRLLLVTFLFTLAAPAAEAAISPPLQLHPENRHYFLFRGRPTVLVTSGEHYGAVLNADFDYLTYLDTLKAEGMNLTRTVPGTSLESTNAGTYRGGDQNTFAPRPGRFLAPWARSDTPGYYYGGNNNLDLSFATDDPTGSGQIQQSDGRFDGRALRKQLRILRDLIESLDFIHMRPDRSAVAIPPHPSGCYALLKPGESAAVYVHSPRIERQAEVLMDLPEGRWRADWMHPASGVWEPAQIIDHRGGGLSLHGPAFTNDMALRQSNC